MDAQCGQQNVGVMLSAEDGATAPGGLRLDDNGETVVIDHYTIDSQALWQHLNDSSSPTEALGELLRLGLVLSDRVAATAASEGLERRVQEVIGLFNDRVRAFEESIAVSLGKSVERHFGPDTAGSATARVMSLVKECTADLTAKQSRLAECFEPGRDGSYLASFEKRLAEFDASLRDRLDPKRTDSLPHAIRDELAAFFGPEGKASLALSLDDENSPLSVLRAEIGEKLSTIRNELAVVRGIREAQESLSNPIEEGFEFEGEVEAVLNRDVAQWNVGDTVINTSRETGESGKLGDFVYVVGEHGSIVIESRDRQSGKSAASVISTCTKALQNRAGYDPKAAVYCVRDPNSQLSDGVGPWNLFQSDTIAVCSIDTLALTVRLLRARMVASRTVAAGVDLQKCLKLIDQASREVAKLSTIRTKCTALEKIATQITTTSGEARSTIEAILHDLEGELRGDTQGGAC